MKSRTFQFALVAVIAAFIGAIGGFYGCKTFQIANLAMLRSKYDVFYQTSPEQIHSTWLLLHHADRSYDKAKGRDTVNTDQTWKDQQEFVKELKAVTGSHTLYYYDSKDRPSSSGFLVVNFYGRVIKDIDFTVISRTN